MSYSQNDEEFVILEHFKGKADGYFLDIGAHDGVWLSNTRRLYELGWKGTLVEAAAPAFTKLLENYKDDPEVVLLNAAVVSPEYYHPDPIAFYESYGDGVSTTSIAHCKKWESAAKFRKYYVMAVSAGDLSLMCNKDPDFISLDVESTNLSLFPSVLEFKNTRMICVEHDGHLETMDAMAKERGYKLIHHNPENGIFAR